MTIRIITSTAITRFNVPPLIPSHLALVRRYSLAAIYTLSDPCETESVTKKRRPLLMGTPHRGGSLYERPYIIPPMPPGIAGVSSSGSATTTSVVTMRLPMEAAFCSAERVTMAGSMMPAATKSS
jgi:hypothetical protein